MSGESLVLVLLVGTPTLLAVVAGVLALRRLRREK